MACPKSFARNCCPRREVNILLDENLDWRLRRDLPGHAVESVAFIGWASLMGWRSCGPLGNRTGVSIFGHPKTATLLHSQRSDRPHAVSPAGPQCGPFAPRLTVVQHNRPGAPPSAAVASSEPSSTTTTDSQARTAVTTAAMDRLSLWQGITARQLATVGGAPGTVAAEAVEIIWRRPQRCATNPLSGSGGGQSGSRRRKNRLPRGALKRGLIRSGASRTH